MGWLFGQSNKMRDAASRLGFSVSEVTRPIPVITRRGKFQLLEEGKCDRYALHRNNRTGIEWQLLQRDAAAGATFPNGYLVQPAEIPAPLRSALQTLAEEFAEEYFEFEGTATEVAVYWEEWGGSQAVERIYQALLPLQAL